MRIAVAWANCRFNEKTEFRSCQFSGGTPPAYCEGFGRVKLQDCQVDPEASSVFNSERVKEGRRKYSLDDLSNDIRSLINKFVIKGVVGLRSVSEFNLNKGSIRASRYRQEIIDELLATVLERHTISGASDGYNVRDEAAEAVRFYAANNVFTGPLRNCFDALAKKFALK